jgi:acyl-CoA thioesterase-1
MMQGVGGEQDLMQQDGMHPNEAAQTILLDNVWKALAPLLGKQAAERGRGAAARLS